MADQVMSAPRTAPEPSTGSSPVAATGKSSTGNGARLAQAVQKSPEQIAAVTGTAVRKSVRALTTGSLKLPKILKR